jgi:hypothetical protein
MPELRTLSLAKAGACGAALRDKEKKKKTPSKAL